MKDTAARQRTSRWKKALFMLVLVALVAGLVAGVFALNRREDRERPMYHDVILMAGLQHDVLEDGQEGVELSISSESAAVFVGSESFTPLPGVEIVVEKREETYCVKGTNQHGDETGWICVDGTGDRPDLGTLEDEF